MSEMVERVGQAIEDVEQPDVRRDKSRPPESQWEVVFCPSDVPISEETTEIISRHASFQDAESAAMDWFLRKRARAAIAAYEECSPIRAALEQIKQTAFYHMVRHTDESGDRKILGKIKEIAIAALKQ